MFLNPPTTLELQQDCEHYTVCIRLCHYKLRVILLRQGRFKGDQGGRPPVKILAFLWSPLMKFIIKHNLPLVGGGSLWQYRSVPPSCNYGHPTAPPPPKKNPERPLFLGYFVCLVWQKQHECFCDIFYSTRPICIKFSRPTRCPEWICHT